MLARVSDYDVIVVGAGNAALAAAVSAREQGAGRVAALEKAPRTLRGGNTHYSGGLFRIAFDRAEDLRILVPEAESEVPGFFAGVEPYPHKLFMADLLRVTDGRTDPELAELLIGRSYDTACWMARQGIEMEPAVSLSAVKVGNTLKWSPGAVIRAKHEGVGLSAMGFRAAERQGVETRYDSAVVRLVQDKTGRVTGVVVQGPEGFAELSAHAVVLGCGGFEANPEWRARYLGRPWDHAKVRGTRYNTGDGLRMAMELGALPHGQWTGCHSTPIDAEAPLDALTTYITPNDLFFVRHHWNPTYQNAWRWALTVDGEVERPMRLTLADLKKMPRANATCVLQCAGNGRGLYKPVVPGVQWKYGAVGNARWTGVRVKELLDRAGLKASARHLHTSGADKPPGKVPPFNRSIEIEKALEDGIVAYEMNGEPLAPPHGAPARHDV